MVPLRQRQSQRQILCGFLLPALSQTEQAQPMGGIGGIPELAGRIDDGCGTLKIGARSLPLTKGKGIQATPREQMGQRFQVAQAFGQRNRLLPTGARLLIIAYRFMGTAKIVERSDE